MKNYFIRVPFTGYVEVEVSAENENVAVERAFELATLEDVVEWELHKKVCEGNVYRGIMNEIDVYED